VRPDPVLAEAVPIPPVLDRLVVELVDRELELARSSLCDSPASVDLLRKLVGRIKKLVSPFQMAKYFYLGLCRWTLAANINRFIL